MTQIQNTSPLPGALAGLGTTANAGRKEGASPDFSRWLNQSSQQLQSQSATTSTPSQQASQQQAQQLAAQQLQTQQQAQQLQSQQQAQRQNAATPAKPARTPESSAAHDENKLAARNAVARQQANRADNARTPARPASTDGAERSDASNRADPAEVKDADAADMVGETARAEGPEDGKDKRVAKEAKDGATPAEQILAMLRGEAPAETRTEARATAADGQEDGTGALPGGAHGKHPTTGDAMRERQELQRELSQAAAGKAGAAEGSDKAARTEAVQAASSGAHDIALGDDASKGPQPSFEALLAAAQQAGPAAGPTGTDASAPAAAPSVPLSQPLDSPDFAPELSASVSLLIQDGIHEAQLQLNPTEMGPVSINIQLDGQQAEVNFHAQHAATREVLERSLPDLAAALQAQGLTLSGGGVFAQTASSGGQQRGDGSSSGNADGRGRRGDRGGDDGVAATGRTERRTAPRGLVDLYA